MFTAEESWKMDEPAKVLALVKKLGVWRLGNTDGCMCFNFSIRNVNIDVSCGKGRDRGLWIDSRSMDYWDGISDNSCDERLLRPIAEEIVRQVEESDGRGPVPIHFHAWEAADKSRTIDGDLAPKPLPRS